MSDAGVVSDGDWSCGGQAGDLLRLTFLTSSEVSNLGSPDVT